GWGLSPLPIREGNLSWDNRQAAEAARGAGGPAAGPMHAARQHNEDRLWAIRNGACQCGPCVKYELGLASLALAARGQGAKGGEGVPEELIGQAIKMVVMHEVGHT